jgi:hypothetical protein
MELDSNILSVPCWKISCRRVIVARAIPVGRRHLDFEVCCAVSASFDFVIPSPTVSLAAASPACLCVANNAPAHARAASMVFLF